MYGWRPDLEDGQNVASITHPVICTGAADGIPAAYDVPPDQWTQDDQGGWPFCHAHMRTGAEELLAWKLTGKAPSYSRYYAAITDMRQDGDDSKPEGASIKGSMIAATRTGCALESTKAYPALWAPSGQNQGRWMNSVYSNTIGSETQASAKLHHIKSLSPAIRSYDQMKAMAISGRYVFAFGLYWTESLSSLQKVSVCTDSRSSGSVLGGHAVLSFGWITKNGDLWFKLQNSHFGWGVDRRVAFSPKWWDSTLRLTQFGMFGISDIALDDYNPQPASLSLAEPSITL